MMPTSVCPLEFLGRFLCRAVFGIANSPSPLTTRITLDMFLGTVCIALANEWSSGYEAAIHGQGQGTPN